MMRICPLHLRSTDIEDAFIYRTTLYCWTFDQRLRAYDVADIEDAVHRTDRDAGPAYTYVMFHTSGRGATASQSGAWLEDRAQDYRGEPQTIGLDAESIPHVEYRMGIDASTLLDFLIFYDRFYFATDEGLFSLDQFDPESLNGTLVPTSRLGETCYAAAAGLGTVAASCGAKGLRLLFDESTIGSRKPRHAASESLRAEIGYGTVVNHTTRADYELLAADVSRQNGMYLLSSVRRASVQSSDEIIESLQADGDGIDYVLWDHSRLVLFQAGSMRAISVIREEDNRRLNRVRTLATYGTGEARVISATRMRAAFAIETNDAVVLVGDDDVAVAPVGPVVSLRSYPRSFRYKDLVTATARDGLWLIGVYPWDVGEWRD